MNSSERVVKGIYRLDVNHRVLEAEVEQDGG